MSLDLLPYIKDYEIDKSRLYGVFLYAKFDYNKSFHTIGIDIKSLLSFSVPVYINISSLHKVYEEPSYLHCLITIFHCMLGHETINLFK